MSTVRKRTNIKLAKLFYKYEDRFNIEKPQEAEEVYVDEEEESYPPYNFSWLVENKIAAMACPHNVGNLNYLADVGINHLITLSPERIPPILECNKKLKWSKIPIKEFDAPTLKQIIKFIGICKKAEITGEIIGIHCRNGHGRTATMLACYLVFFNNMPAERAILTVKAKRPGACETLEQEKIVCHYQDCVRGTLTKPDYRLVDDKKYFDFEMKYTFPDVEIPTKSLEEPKKEETFKEKLLNNTEFIKKVDKIEKEKSKRMKTMVINHKIYF